ncbi:MAG: response regulator transcription factor, partial [Burkholderiales bacterium]
MPNETSDRPEATRQCLVVEDQESIRAWLVSALGEAFEDMAVAEAATLNAARHWVAAQERDATLPFAMALVDLGLPDGSGIELL